jgi:hypothetical protein
LWIRRLTIQPWRLTSGAVEDHHKAVEAHNGAGEITMDTGRVCMDMVADSHHFDFDFSHQREKLVLTLS